MSLISRHQRIIWYVLRVGRVAPHAGMPRFCSSPTHRIHRRSSIKSLVHSTWEVSSPIHLNIKTSSRLCGKTLQCRRCELCPSAHPLRRLTLPPQAISKGKKLALPDKYVPPIAVRILYDLTYTPLAFHSTFPPCRSTPDVSALTTITLVSSTICRVSSIQHIPPRRMCVPPCCVINPPVFCFPRHPVSAY